MSSVDVIVAASGAKDLTTNAAMMFSSERREFDLALVAGTRDSVRHPILFRGLGRRFRGDRRCLSSAAVNGNARCGR